MATCSDEDLWRPRSVGMRLVEGRGKRDKTVASDGRRRRSARSAGDVRRTVRERPPGVQRAERKVAGSAPRVATYGGRVATDVPGAGRSVRRDRRGPISGAGGARRRRPPAAALSGRRYLVFSLGGEEVERRAVQVVLAPTRLRRGRRRRSRRQDDGVGRRRFHVHRVRTG